MNKNRSATVQQNILYLKARGRQMLTKKALLKPCLDRFLLTAHINRRRGPVTSVSIGSSSSRSRSFRRSQKDLRTEKALPTCTAVWPGGSHRSQLNLCPLSLLPLLLWLSLFSLITYFFLPVDLGHFVLHPHFSTLPTLSSFYIALFSPFSRCHAPS